MEKKSVSFIKLAPFVIRQDFDGEAVLLHLLTENYYALNSTALKVLIAGLEHHSFAEAIDSLTDLFDVSREVLEKDAADFFDALFSRGLVERV